MSVQSAASAFFNSANGYYWHFPQLFTLEMKLKWLGSQASRFLGENTGFLALPDFLTL
jgi:hypothetical protein